MTDLKLRLHCLTTVLLSSVSTWSRDEARLKPWKVQFRQGFWRLLFGIQLGAMLHLIWCTAHNCCQTLCWKFKLFQLSPQATPTFLQTQPMRYVWRSQKRHSQAVKVKSDGGKKLRLCVKSSSKSITLQTTISPEKTWQNVSNLTGLPSWAYSLVSFAVMYKTDVWYHKHSFINSRWPEDEMTAPALRFLEKIALLLRG